MKMSYSINQVSEITNIGRTKIYEARQKAKLVKIFKLRPDSDHGKIIFEISKEGARATPNGRIVKMSLLRRAYKNDKKKKTLQEL